MEYNWKEKTIYIATPTILPFSPFGKNIFFFSIFKKINEEEETDPKSIPCTAIHEISHFIFYELLEKIQNTQNIKLPIYAKYYLKEALTTSLLNQDSFKNLLEQGNPEIRELYLVDKEKKIKITEYITKQYLKAKKENKSFENFLTTLVINFNNSSKYFTEKRNLWRMHGSTIFEKPNALSNYQQPIDINSQ